jgi:beta-glucosidase
MKENERITISLPITNIGSREGYEVVQLYISDKKSSLPRPIKELKGFKKVRLSAGETKTVSFVIDKTALNFFDDSQHKWITEPGKFEAIIGSSSEDIRAKVTFVLK